MVETAEVTVKALKLNRAILGAFEAEDWNRERVGMGPQTFSGECGLTNCTWGNCSAAGLSNPCCA
jgi:hypothetical protein